MLVVLPASDAKAHVRRGVPFDVTRLSFPELGPTRVEVLDALTAVSAEPDAPRRLGLRPTMAIAVRANLDLREAPAAAAGAVYAGVLYRALDVGSLDAAARRRARSQVVVVSALWGAVRIGDRIPPYRLDMCGRLPGLAHLTAVWRAGLDEVLPAAAGRGVVVDCRSGDYATAWRPSGALADRTVVVRVVRGVDDPRGAGGHRAKHGRGLLVRRMLTDAIEPGHPEELATALAAHFDVALSEPDRAGRAWRLDVVDPLG